MHDVSTWYSSSVSLAPADVISDQRRHDRQADQVPQPQCFLRVGIFVSSAFGPAWKTVIA